MRRRLPGRLLAALVAVALIGIAPVPPRAVEPFLSDTVIQAGLDHPWDIVFAPDGRMFVSERPGRVVIFASAAPGAARLNTVAIDGVHASGEAGAMGMVLDPAFATNRFLYLCVSRDDELEWRNQVIRYVVVGNDLVFDRYVIRSGMSAASIHDGCRVRFGPDGKLWVTMGDASDPQVAQDPQSLNGKVLRLNPDGAIPPDNPVWPGAAGPSAVYTIGHRNPQGIAFSPADGQPFNMEHSHHRVSPTQYEHDTINALQAGANYGWPEVADPNSGFAQPAWGSGAGRTLAISGGAFVSGTAWGDWSGHLFVGALSGAALLHFAVSGNSVTELEPHLVGTYGRLRSPVFGSDGFLYVTTDGGDDVIVRITPSLPRPATKAAGPWALFA